MDVVYNSAVDVLVDALKRSGREIYLHSLIYFGEHKCPRHALAENFSAAVSKQMETYHDEELTGYCLIYSNKFINVVEGSEGAIMQHLEDIVKMIEKPEALVGPNAQVFVEECHIKKRLYNTFQTTLATPPTLAQLFPANPSVQEVYRHINNFYDKYIKVIEVIRRHSQSRTTALNLDVQGSKIALMLPEAELVAFLMRSQHLLSLQSVVAGHKYPPYFELYPDIIWPVVKTSLPYYIFLEQLNKEDAKEEELEEKEEEEEAIKEEEHNVRDEQNEHNVRDEPNQQNTQN